MKITKQHLRKVIMEEVTNLLKEKSKRYGTGGHQFRRHNVDGVEKKAGEGPEEDGHRHFKDFMKDKKAANKKPANRPGNRVNEETADEREDKNIDSLWRYARQNRRSLNKLLKDAGHDELEGERDDD